ncbi:Sec-independent protein translocase protein TatB [Roseovarius sp. THAF9]|uniref:Sec-independent protein translocase protein TatB n=1 Tax=Roseovarius sp. THAF9 TaxID=2587847 RepID=UPI00126833D5|nr:Sec-independent protein translocase protein TatB [Roseovarius sp. THAF9]QFT92717.1 Sec-independent protein translocase protein TatB [Roseovarius sp. THAF9]
MFDLGWTELMVIGIVALIVVGPKDLPGMFRTVGRFVGKAKQMAREFSRAMNDAAEESGVNEVSKSLKSATNPMGAAMDEVKKSTDSFTAKTMAGPEPKRAEFDDDRKAMVDKISKRSAEMAEERKAAEEAAKAAAEDAGAGKSGAARADSTAKSTPAKNGPAKKAAPKKEGPKKATAAKAGAEKPAAKKPASDKPV